MAIFCTLCKLPAIKDKGAARRGRKEREQSHNDITASNDYRLTGKSPCRCIQPMCCLWLAYAVSQFPVRFFARCLAIRKCSSTRSLIGDSITCFNKSKIVCADSQGESPLMLHYIDAAMRQNREKVCFIKGKSKHLVSNHRSFREENINIFRKSYRFKKNKWTFFRSFSCFFYFLTCFREKIRPSSSPLSSFRFLARTCAPKRTRTYASRTQRVRNTSLHPSPSHLTT